MGWAEEGQGSEETRTGVYVDRASLLRVFAGGRTIP